MRAQMINFIKKLFKWFVVYPIAACAAIAFVLTITGWEPSEQPVAQAETETVEVAVALPAPTPTFTAMHQRCFENKRAMDYRNNPDLTFIIKQDGKFGTFDDGEIWVGYTRQVFPEGAILGDSIKYRNQRVICKPFGQPY